MLRVGDRVYNHEYVPKYSNAYCDIQSLIRRAHNYIIEIWNRMPETYVTVSESEFIDEKVLPLQKLKLNR